jgi:hypothetical protein
VWYVAPLTRSISESREVLLFVSISLTRWFWSAQYRFRVLGLISENYSNIPDDSAHLIDASWYMYCNGSMGKDGEQRRSTSDDRVTSVCVEEASSNRHWRECGQEALSSPQGSPRDISIRQHVLLRDSFDVRGKWSKKKTTRQRKLRN